MGRIGAFFVRVRAFFDQFSAFRVGSGRFIDARRFVTSNWDVLGRVGAFFVRVRAFFAQIGAFWVRFELVLNPGPKSMVS